MLKTTLEDLRALKPNWDAEGALVIDPNIIDAAKDLMAALPSELMASAAIVPMSGGRLQFEWHEHNKSLEIELEDPHTIHYLRCPSNDDRTWDEGSCPIESIELVEKFIRAIFGGC